MNTQIIAIANQKGGVGKTTTCANLGIGLAQAGKKVLLIDGDPQGSLTISLGNPQPDKLPFTLSDAMGRILTDQPVRPGEGILRHPEGVDLMPADIQLSGMEVSLVNAMSRETILRQYLDSVKGQYSHRRAGVSVGGHIGVTAWKAGADIVGGGRVCGVGAVDYGRGPQECLGAAVGTFDIHSFHGDRSFLMSGWLVWIWDGPEHTS